MGNDKRRGRQPIHDEPLQPAATRLPAAVIRWLLRRNPDNVSDALRQQLMDDYNSSKNDTNDD